MLFLPDKKFVCLAGQPIKIKIAAQCEHIDSHSIQISKKPYSTLTLSRTLGALSTVSFLEKNMSTMFLDRKRFQIFTLQCTVSFLDCQM